MMSIRTMAELKCVVFWGIVTLFWTLCRGETEVSCVFNETCVLPCSFQSTSNPTIHWTHLTAEESLVHSYYDHKDQVEHQNQNFRGRTFLIGNQVSSGNASLLLTGVKIQDEGRYKCNISSPGGTKLFFINVTVDAPVKTVHLQQTENRITCSADGIYPEPQLTWSTIPPTNMLLRSSTTVRLTEQQLHNISSLLIVPDNTNLTYSCTIRTRWNNKTASLGKQEKTNTGRGIAIVAVVILVTVSMSLVPCFAEKLKKLWESKCSNKKKILKTEELECETSIIQATELNAVTSMEKGSSSPGTEKPNKCEFYISRDEDELASSLGT
ncbi:PREDICTED: V-set domain-containing T-cell activation inhibitor 1-like [Cyprinodon variegatus]|nr:PREDICTED: V-set domain-containing T-cell activation inhibitor 1-like [Cyprinodon variegatus]